MTEQQEVFAKNNWKPGTILTSECGMVLVTAIGLNAFLGYQLRYSGGKPVQVRLSWGQEQLWMVDAEFWEWREARADEIPTDDHIQMLTRDVQILLGETREVGREQQETQENSSRAFPSTRAT